MFRIILIYSNDILTAVGGSLIVRRLVIESGDDK